MTVRPAAFGLAVAAAFVAGTLAPTVVMTQSAQSQEAAFALVGYMKVAPGKEQQYLALERELDDIFRRTNETPDMVRVEIWNLMEQIKPIRADS